MNYIYKLTTTQKTDEAGVIHTVYGIEVHEVNADIPTRTVEDIFTDFSEAEHFVSACNMLHLDIEHLDDVIYDTLNA